ncbi:hypothetical protein Leryth_026856 [Lithospermum erythrorhizon]|nr:hypothetical protein Leryth_026856 [Lithospermum erythrorhizon]
MVELGVIQSLVDMKCIQALVELSNGSFMNKAVIMEAGLLPNLPGKVDSLDESTKQEYAILLFCYHHKIKYPLKSSQMITFVSHSWFNYKIKLDLLCFRNVA